jgi:eukaryotic-like serine/threonine-protein kinase
MDITAPFVLRSDVLLVPVAELDEQLRASIAGEPDDVALTRPRSRTPSTVVEASAARLVELFRQPRPLVEALVLYGRQEGRDPDSILEDAYALLLRLLQAGFMVPAGDGAEIVDAEDGPVLAAGAAVDDVTIVRPLYVLEDTDLYLARGADNRHFALKLQRPGSRVGPLFEREARVLRAIGGEIAPRLERQGELDGKRYLLMEWCPGVDAELAAGEHRGEPDGRSGTLRVLTAIADAYAELHRRGVLHGDVHPRNVLVDHAGVARLIDFGFAELDGPAEATPDATHAFARGGIPFFYEPEFARAALDGTPPPPATAAGEQFALAAMFYQLVAGAYYADFSMGREAMLHEVLEQTPVPFARRGMPPWPDLEEVLLRGLAKEPADRFPSMDAFAQAIRSVRVPGAGADGAAHRDTRPLTDAKGRDGVGAIPVLSPLAAAAESILQEIGFDGGSLHAEPERGPVASLNYGAAGVALAVARMAAARSDGGLLALADAWCCRAEALATRPDAFENAEIEMTSAAVGSAAPLHAAAGVAAVRAFIGRAFGDDGMQADAVARFVAASADGHRGHDLTLGRSATVLGAALLVDSLPASIPAEPLLEIGRRHLEETWRWVRTLDDVARAPELTNLGIAHGWAGLLYAALQWHRATGDPLPVGLHDRLEQLGRLAEPASRGVVWPWSLGADGPSTTMPGWCNGTAGHVALWALAHSVLGDPHSRDRAIAAAWEAWDAPDGAGTLCCGLVGRSYALLRVHRLTGDRAWLRRAERLAERAASFGQFEDDFPLSLYKGRVALAVLAADIDRPGEAAHPFFEEERWPPRELPAARLTLGARPQPAPV